MRPLLLATALVSAAPAAAQQQDLSKVEIKVEQVAPGVAVLFGAGGNIGVSHGADGNVLIDDQFAPLVPKIVAAVKTLDPDPISFLINTHWHGDHTGGNEALGSGGTVIVAQDNVRRRLSVDTVSKRFNSTIKAAPRSALPVITFDRGVTFHLNGDTLQVVHVADAHTDGDALIYWQKANVLHAGDTFFNRVTFPFIDRESGGSIDDSGPRSGCDARGLCGLPRHAGGRAGQGGGGSGGRADQGADRRRQAGRRLPWPHAGGLHQGRRLCRNRVRQPALVPRRTPGHLDCSPSGSRLDPGVRRDTSSARTPG
jgi:glyoxylase-like metal-dependent hydrolase (beta-lactamase superfamily II)